MNPAIFKSSALKKFLTTTLAEINPSLSIASTTLDYYSDAF